MLKNTQEMVEDVSAQEVLFNLRSGYYLNYNSIVHALLARLHFAMH